MEWLMEEVMGAATGRTKPFEKPWIIPSLSTLSFLLSLLSSTLFCEASRCKPRYTNTCLLQKAVEKEAMRLFENILRILLIIRLKIVLKKIVNNNEY